MHLRMIVFAGAAAISACGPAAIPDEQRKPDLVKVGISVRQVESLMGPHNDQPCWNYQRNGFAERVCFADGLANFLSKSPLVEPDPNRRTIDATFAGEWPLKRLPSPNATTVTLGTSQRRVEALWGVPKSVEYSFLKGQMIYRTTFINGTLTEVEVVPPPVLPMVP
jgi:hypothetical protein